MRHIVRHSMAIVFLASVPAARAVAQSAAIPDLRSRAPQADTLRGVPPADSLRGAPPADSGRGKSDILPVIEIGGFLTLLNVTARIVLPNEMQDGKKVYSSTFQTTWDHLREQRWVHDLDPFNVNQFWHPYQGATMYGFSRSAGHGFWTSLLHSNIGSFVWKMAGETDPPSINDMITTGQAGSLLGEALYRMSDLVLKAAGGDDPRPFAVYAAAFLSPPSAFNRRVFGDRYKGLLPETHPATVWQVKFGASLATLAKEVSAPTSLLRSDASAQFAMSYGLPGQPGYTYSRPLDYFDIEVSVLANARNSVENMMVRGLLIGRKTADTEHTSGIWGLYGSYDYISPFLFRVSSTALSLGTTREYAIRPDLNLQGSLLGGVGYGAAGSTTVIASTPTNAAVRDYHFGVTPQALLALRLIAWDRAMVDMSAREFYVSGVGSDDTHGTETIVRANFGVTLHLRGPHAIGAGFVVSTRDARYGLQPNRKSSEGMFTLSYSILGGTRLGAVKTP